MNLLSRPKYPSIECFSGPAPVTYEQVAEYHPSDVGCMGNAAAGAGDGTVELYGGVSYDHIFCFYGYWREDEHQLRIGEEHPEGQQHTVDSSRGSDDRCVKYPVQTSHLLVGKVLALPGYLAAAVIDILKLLGREDVHN